MTAPDSLRTRLASPIPGSSPMGDDPKYLPDFEFVKSEIAKTASRDWERIVQSAETVLQGNAKDLTLLCYHLVAVVVHSGWEPASQVAGAIHDLCRDHWDAIHPARERARANAFRWLLEERTMGTLEQVAYTSDDHEALAAFANEMEGLRGLLLSKFAEDAPQLKPLVAFLQERVRATKPAAPPAAPPPAVASSAPAAAPAASSAPAPAVSGVEVPAQGASRGDLLRTLQKVALALLKLEPDAAMGFKLLRMVRWQDLTVAPKAEGGRTSLPPPNPQRRAWFEAQFQQRNWTGILEGSETAFTEPGIHFWLDLQHFVVVSLEGKGAAAAADAVRAELRTLLQRVPQLVELRFNDGTPFLSGPSKAWVEELVSSGSGGGNVSAAVREETLESDLAQAREIASAGKVPEALGLLEGGLQFGNGRSRASRRLEIARLALMNGKNRAALAQTSLLYRQCRAMALSDWEPEFGAAVADLHLKALGAVVDAAPSATSDELRMERERVSAEIGADHPSLLARQDL